MSLIDVCLRVVVSVLFGFVCFGLGMLMFHYNVWLATPAFVIGCGIGGYLLLWNE